MSTVDEAAQIIAEAVGDTMPADVAAKALAAANHAEEQPSPTPLDKLPLLSPPTAEEENTIRQKYRLPPKPDRT